MKKYFLFILIGLHCILAFNYAGDAAIKKKSISFLAPGNYVSPAFHIPNTEMEIFTVRTGVTSQANHNVQKLFGDNETGVRNSLTYDYCQ